MRLAKGLISGGNEYTVQSLLAFNQKVIRVLLYLWSVVLTAPQSYHSVLPLSSAPSYRHTAATSTAATVAAAIAAPATLLPPLLPSLLPSLLPLQ